MMSPDERKLCEQIAHLQLMGTPHEHIAAVVEISVDEVQQVLADEDYQKVETHIAGKMYQRNKDIADKWQDVEEMSLNNLITTLRFNRDADLNLRAAVMANKADKRSHGITPIQGQQGMRASIGLPAVFVQMIQNNGGTIAIQQNKPEKDRQRFNILAPGRVESLLGKTQKDEEENMFAGINFAGAK